MKAFYLVEIKNPQNHLVKVTLRLEKVEQSKIKVFLPSWSPGSYLMREYSRHVRWFSACQKNGEVLFYRQVAKGTWEIDWDKSEIKSRSSQLEIQYEIYCKELTVRTSHVDSSHAFLHGPSYLMGVVDAEMKAPVIEFRFPESWSKLSTALKDISQKRDIFLYSALNYDELIDSPVEIGCHETDGFVFQGKAHTLAFYGEQYPHKNDLKSDIKKIVETVSRHFEGDLPYQEYLFLTHFVPKLYGGLEHLNSTALHFDGRKLAQRKDYLSYLSLVAHEYFHLWNVKRIRPKELGPFDLRHEAYTTLLWLAEGLTSFMDDLLIYRAKLCSLEEYLDSLKSHLDQYYSTPGRRYHSLEDSSFNAWIKLYRPDENSKNSTVSYYLKGGLVFLVLHSHLVEKGRSINHFLKALWEDYKNHPERGLTKKDIFRLIKEIGGEEVKENFASMVETTFEIDFDSVFQKIGLSLHWTEPQTSWTGMEFEFIQDRVFVKTILLDSPAYKQGLNAGDELIFLNGLRFIKEDAEKLSSLLVVDQTYEFVISRLSKMENCLITPSRAPRQLKEILIEDRKKAESFLL